MQPTLVAPYGQLLDTLAAFTGSVAGMQIAEPTGAHTRWRREVSLLKQAVAELRACAGDATRAPGDSTIRSTLERVVRRLTQLARTQDGLRLEQSKGAPAAQLGSERQIVVLAAWQLLEAMEQLPASSAGSREPVAAEAPTR